MKNEVLQRVKDERNVLQVIQRRKANCIDHCLRRNCLLKHAMEGKIGGSIEVTGRRGRRRKQLLDDLKEGEETERGSTRSPSMENSLWKRLWICRKRDSKMNEPHSLYKFTSIHESAVFNVFDLQESK